MTSTTKKNTGFKAKNIILLILIIISVCFIFSFTRLLIEKYISEKNYAFDVYTLNHLTRNDLYGTYIDKSFGITFNYPKNGSIFSPYGSTSWLEVFSKSDRQGALCDIKLFVPKQDILSKNVSGRVRFNGITWTKWKEVMGKGTKFESQIVSWYTENSYNNVLISSTADIEGYCENIISTFKFTK